MSNSMTVLAMVISKTTIKSCIEGTAAYRPNSKKLKHFDFKLFTGANKDLHPFEEGDLLMFSGKFTFRKGYESNPIFVCL